jgi:hypothetical protein
VQYLVVSNAMDKGEHVPEVAPPLLLFGLHRNGSKRPLPKSYHQMSWSGCKPYV